MPWLYYLTGPLSCQMECLYDRRAVSGLSCFCPSRSSCYGPRMGYVLDRGGLGVDRVPLFKRCPVTFFPWRRVVVRRGVVGWQQCGGVVGQVVCGKVGVLVGWYWTLLAVVLCFLPLGFDCVEWMVSCAGWGVPALSALLVYSFTVTAPWFLVVGWVCLNMTDSSACLCWCTARRWCCSRGLGSLR